VRDTFTRGRLRQTVPRATDAETSLPHPSAPTKHCRREPQPDEAHATERFWSLRAGPGPAVRALTLVELRAPAPRRFSKTARTTPHANAPRGRGRPPCPAEGGRPENLARARSFVGAGARLIPPLSSLAVSKFLKKKNRYEPPPAAYHLTISAHRALNPGHLLCVDRDRPAGAAAGSVFKNAHSRLKRGSRAPGRPNTSLKQTPRVPATPSAGMRSNHVHEARRARVWSAQFRNRRARPAKLTRSTLTPWPGSAPATRSSWLAPHRCGGAADAQISAS